MNKPLLFGFLGVMVVVLGLPLLAQISKGSSGGGTSSGSAATGAAPAPATGTYSAPPVASGPALDASSLAGTSWRVATSRGPVTATFNPGGVLSAQHALAGSINGTWQVSGNQVTLNATALGRPISIPLQISGGSLLYEGKPIDRLN